MALQVDWKMAGGLKVRGAYLMVNNVRRDRLTGIVQFSLLAFVDRGVRAAAGAAFVAATAAEVRLTEAVQAVRALAAAAEAAATPELLQEISAEKREAQTAAIGAKAEADAAVAMLDDPDLRPFWREDACTFSRVASAEVAPDGVIDLAKVYAVIKRERYPEAVDLV